MVAKPENATPEEPLGPVVGVALPIEAAAILAVVSLMVKTDDENINRQLSELRQQVLYAGGGDPRVASNTCRKANMRFGPPRQPWPGADS